MIQAFFGELKKLGAHIGATVQSRPRDGLASNFDGRTKQ